MQHVVAASNFYGGGYNLTAQDNLNYIYLKNGQVIQGQILDKLFKDRITVKTLEGQTVYLPTDIIDEITKSKKVKTPADDTDNSSKTKTADSVADSNKVKVKASAEHQAITSKTENKATKTSFREKISQTIEHRKLTLASDTPYGWNMTRRYRGFIGQSIIFSGGDDFDIVPGTELQFSNGYQITPLFYVGAGFGCGYDWYKYNWDDVKELSCEKYTMIFVHARGEFHKPLYSKVSPYLDAKIGFETSDASLYLEPQLGCHFYFGRSPMGLSIGLSYKLFREVEYYKEDDDEDYYDNEGKKHSGYIGLSISFDF